MEVLVLTKMKCVFVLRIMGEMQKMVVNECGSLEREYTYSIQLFLFLKAIKGKQRKTQKKVKKRAKEAKPWGRVWCDICCSSTSPKQGPLFCFFNGLLTPFSLLRAPHRLHEPYPTHPYLSKTGHPSSLLPRCLRYYPFQGRPKQTHNLQGSPGR